MDPYSGIFTNLSQQSKTHRPAQPICSLLDEAKTGASMNSYVRICARIHIQIHAMYKYKFTCIKTSIRIYNESYT